MDVSPWDTPFGGSCWPRSSPFGGGRSCRFTSDPPVVVLKMYHDSIHELTYVLLAGCDNDSLVHRSTSSNVYFGRIP
eukprot:1576485-Amphidinium_carterae.2